MKQDLAVRPTGSALAPFAVASLLAWLAVPIGSAVSWSEYAVSVVLVLLVTPLATVRVNGRRLPGTGIVVNSFVFLLAVALLRDSAGGIGSAAGVLSLLPVFYTALHSRSARKLGQVLLGVAAFYLLPILIVGRPAYPDTQYRAALLSVIVATIIGLTTQRLVAAVRHQAHEAQTREQMLEQVTLAVHGLLSSVDARGDVCEAIRTIGEASAAALFEPAPGGDVMRSTAVAGLEAPPVDVPIAKASALTDVFASGAPQLITENIRARVASPELWEASGKPESVLYQPVMRGGAILGVLVVGWRGVAPEGARATVVALLAHEVGAVIDRADALDELADQAQTDALTGLPNRRAWDDRIEQVVAQRKQVAVALLDFDHFKEFNDTFGHPAGDRLLKETAAAWRDELRSGDLLARLGGEEFGLLLIDADRSTAAWVIERLRARMSQGRTCSAGIAVRGPGESSESVIARADGALYEAKAGGRDRACVSA